MELLKPSGLVSLYARPSVRLSPPVPAEWSTLIGPTVGVDTNSWANESAPLWTRVGVDTGVDTNSLDQWECSTLVSTPVGPMRVLHSGVDTKSLLYLAFQCCQPIQLHNLKTLKSL